MKNNLAKKIEAPDRQLTGAVVTAGATLVVSTEVGRLSARRARSCLVEPRVGDEVVVYVTGDRAYVLAVLEGDAAGPTTLAVEGDLSIKLADGRLAIAAQRGVSMASGEAVSIAAPEVTVHAGVANVVLDRLSWLASVVHGEVERARLVAGSIDRVVERVTDRIKRSYRTVEEIDQLRADSIDWEASKNVSLHCENALLTAQNLVKMDADQIHLG